MAGNLLELRGVSKVYQRGLINAHATVALQNMSLTLKEDEPTIMTVAGESGSGKTTLAMLLLGFITPTTGEILYKGRNITTLTGADRLAYAVDRRKAWFSAFFSAAHSWSFLNSMGKLKSVLLGSVAALCLVTSLMGFYVYANTRKKKGGVQRNKRFSKSFSVQQGGSFG